jgi:glycosyltransferase involved in cell wall biosynthesis
MYSLGIVQTHITQFDGPLFRKLASDADINLTVYLTRPDGDRLFFDPELNHMSGWDHDVVSGFDSHPFPSSISGRLRMVRRIATAGHDLIVIAGYSSIWSLSVALMGRLRGTHVGLRADSVLLYRTKTTWKWRLKDFLLPKLYRMYSTMHPIGSLARAAMLHYGAHEDAIFLFPYAVDTIYLRHEYEKVLPQRNALRHELGITPDAQVILGVLKFIPREDPLTLLEAFARMTHDLPDAQLVLVGSGAMQEDLNRFIARHSLQDNVHLPGYILYSQLPRYFAIADIFVHPARVEPWGATVQEAMVCGLPVLAADTVGAAYDLVKPGQSGFRFQAGNADELAHLLRKLLSDRALCESMREQGSKLASEWSYELTLNQTRCSLQYVTSTGQRGVGRE